jgi:hypothetical protein
MAATTTLITRDHFLRFANLILLVVPATKATIWLPAYSLFLFLWPRGEYGLSDRGEVVWRWGLSKGITLGTLRVLANMVGSISGNRQRKDGLVWVYFDGIKLQSGINERVGERRVNGNFVEVTRGCAVFI